MRGNQNLTSRTIGEILGAIDYDLTGLEVEDRLKEGRNVEFESPRILILKSDTSDTSKNTPGYSAIVELKVS